MKSRTRSTVASLMMAAAFATFTLAPTVTLAASSAHNSYAANTNKSRSKKPSNANTKAQPGAKANEAPAGATAECRDGTYSYSAHRRGTCSHHGGVKRWLR